MENINTLSKDVCFKYLTNKYKLLLVDIGKSHIGIVLIRV